MAKIIFTDEFLSAEDRGHLEWYKKNLNRSRAKPINPDVPHCASRGDIDKAYADYKNNLVHDRLYQSSVTPEDSDFIEYRKRFYGYLYKFYSLAKNTNPEILGFYKILSEGSEHNTAYGMVADDRLRLMSNYDLTLVVDLSLSKRESELELLKSVKDIWEKIEEMYKLKTDVYREYITDYPLKSDGKRKSKNDLEKLFKSWDTAIDAFEKYKESKKKIKSAIASSMKLPRRSDVFERHYKDALRLIRAAESGRLYDAACEAITTLTKSKKQRKKKTDQ